MSSGGCYTIILNIEAILLTKMTIRISFLAKARVRKRVSFTSGGQRISFIAKELIKILKKYIVF